MDIKKQSRSIALYLILSFLPLSTSAVTPSIFDQFEFSEVKIENLELSAAGGFSWLSSNDTYVLISAYETDKIFVNSISNNFIGKIGVGYPILENDLTGMFFDKVMLELNLYRTTATLRGDVWQFEFPQFNNYSYNAPVTSTRLMLDIKPFLFTYRCFSPYIILGLGVAFNAMSYNERVTGEGVDPESALSLGRNYEKNFAYDVGIGIRTSLTKQLDIAVEYLYTHLGDAIPSSSSGIVTMAAPPKFNLTSQSVFLGVNWKIC